MLTLATTPADSGDTHVPAPYTGKTAPTRSQLPLLGQPPRFANEVELPVPPGFTWPTFDVLCLHDHSGSMRESWGSHTRHGRPLRACSVAYRRTMQPPSDHCMHVIGDVFAFLAAYPHPAPAVTSHVDCADANFASWRTWPAKIRSGAMRRRAEEVHYMRSIGACAAAEQPPTAHEYILGAADFSTAAELHGSKATKSYLWFTRGFGAVQPTDIVPLEQRVDAKASVSGTTEERMLQRSQLARSVADAHTAAWLPAIEAVPAAFSRPAAEPCDSYEQGRATLGYNFTLFAARYAPRLRTTDLDSPTRDWRAVIVIPMHAASGTWALLPDDGVYGARHTATSTLEHQAEELCTFLAGGVPPALACIAANATRDYVVLLPHTSGPLNGATTVAKRASMTALGHEHIWCTPAALEGTPAEYVSLALRRVDSSRRSTAPAEGIQIGMWELPRPVINRPSAHAWNLTAPSADAPADWDDFLARDRAAAIAFKAALVAADKGDGQLIGIADAVLCAADVAEELTPPLQGAQELDLEWLRRHPYPARTPSVSAAWLAAIPEQHLPPGCPDAVSWTDAVRPWARRMVCTTLDASIDHGVDLHRHGTSSKRRGSYLCLGPGAAHDVPHVNGVGTWNYLDVLWRRRHDGLLTPMKFGKRVEDHKDLEYLFDLFSPPGGPRCSDQELLSMLSRKPRADGPDPIGGAVFKAGGSRGPPRQIRIDRNLTSLDARLQQVATATRKLIQKGLYRGVPIRNADGKLDPDSAMCPLLHVPGYVNSCGGADKGAVTPGVPAAEARRIGNDSSPHTAQRERNSPHGEPDGPVVLSKNELTGPKKAPPGYGAAEYTGPECPWPNKECKQGPHDLRGGCAVLRSLAAIDGKQLVSNTSDVKWMFWQIYTHGSQYHLCCFMLVMLLEPHGSPVAVMIEEGVLNMGLRPASKIACRFSEEWMEAWRRALRAWVGRGWLRRQSSKLQAALQWRRDHLSPEDADPFWAAPYTDDYAHAYLDAEVGVAGIQIELEMAAKANLWMSPKYGVGTFLDWIGGRAVLNYNFTTLTPAKRTRAISDCTLALAGQLTRGRFESHSSFMVHTDLWLDFPVGTLKGMSGPLKRPGFDTDMITMTANSAAAMESGLRELQRRPNASFLSAVGSAAATEAAAGRRRVEFASDACSDLPLPRVPHICWAVHGTMQRFRLDGAWSAAHITLTEACGPALAVIEFSHYFPDDTIVLASDATAAIAAQLNKSGALVLQMMMRRLRIEPAYTACVARLFITHCAGFANILTDAGSRDKLHVVRALAAAYGPALPTPVTRGDGIHGRRHQVRGRTHHRAGSRPDLGELHAGQRRRRRLPPAPQRHHHRPLTRHTGQLPAHARRVTAQQRLRRLRPRLARSRDRRPSGRVSRHTARGSLDARVSGGTSPRGLDHCSPGARRRAAARRMPLRAAAMSRAHHRAPRDADRGRGT